jgi:hypothetical protein
MSNGSPPFCQPAATRFLAKSIPGNPESALLRDPESGPPTTRNRSSNRHKLRVSATSGLRSFLGRVDHFGRCLNGFGFRLIAADEHSDPHGNDETTESSQSHRKKILLRTLRNLSAHTGRSLLKPNVTETTKRNDGATGFKHNADSRGKFAGFV